MAEVVIARAAFHIAAAEGDMRLIGGARATEAVNSEADR